MREENMTEDSPAGAKRQSGGRLSDPVLVGIRQAFYDGLARRCLAEAWLRLGQVREEKLAWRLFRGRNQQRQGIPLDVIANKLGRDVGTVARWFRGESPNWSNLLMAMTALDADWEHLKSLPSKTERRRAAISRALLHVSKTILGDERDRKGPTLQDLDFLEGLFERETWQTERRLPTQRQMVLQQRAKEIRADWKALDLAVSRGEGLYHFRGEDRG
jgi:hypothetical protein